MAPSGWMTCVFAILILNNYCYLAHNFTKEDLINYRERVRAMFHHAYEGYLKHAYPYDELQPLSCKGHDTWGSYSLTLVDALDTLAIMGNHTEFQRVAKLLLHTLDFDKDINVSVFETNIRVVGGLLSAHLLSRRAGMVVEHGWPCSGPLLRLAEKVARKLLPAFETSTGMPYGTVNLINGVPKGEVTITCTAGVGTFLLEFGSLSRLTGDPIFEEKAMKALKALYDARSPIGLVGNHINVQTGKWTALDAGIGAGIDSYLEYLVKGAILFQYPGLMDMFYDHASSIESYLKREDWYMWSHMTKGTVTLPVFQSLEAFWPGLQSLVGDIDKAMKTLHNYHQVWKQFGFTPEFYNIPKAEPQSSREGYPLRPELIESTMYLYRATRDPFLLEVGVDILEAIETHAKTKCGYATVKDVRDHRLEDRMESFFLAETTKYLYLLFDTDNFIHNDGRAGSVIRTPNGECIIDAGGYVFNTEAHPVDPAALYCCSAEKKQEDRLLQDFHDNVDLLSLLSITPHKDDMFDNVDEEKWMAVRRKQFDRTSSPEVPVGPGVPAMSLQLTLPQPGKTNVPSGAKGDMAQNIQAPEAPSKAEIKKKLDEFTNVDEAVAWMVSNIKRFGDKLAQVDTGLNVGKGKVYNIKDIMAMFPTKPDADTQQDVKVSVTGEVKTATDEVVEGSPTGLDAAPEGTPDKDLTQQEESEGKSEDSSDSLFDKYKAAVIGGETAQPVKEEKVDSAQTEETSDSVEQKGTPLGSPGEGAPEVPVIPVEEGTAIPEVTESSSGEEVVEEEVCVELEGQNEQEEEREHLRQERLLSCPAQPFTARLSVMGEMFTTS